MPPRGTCMVYHTDIGTWERLGTFVLVSPFPLCCRGVIPRHEHHLPPSSELHLSERNQQLHYTNILVSDQGYPESTCYTSRACPNCILRPFFSTLNPSSPHLGQIIDSQYSSWSRYLPFRADLFPMLDDLEHVSWVGSVLYRSCTTFHNGRLGSIWSRSWSIWSIWSRSWSISSIWSRSWSIWSR